MYSFLFSSRFFQHGRQTLECASTCSTSLSFLALTYFRSPAPSACFPTSRDVSSSPRNHPQLPRLFPIRQADLLPLRNSRRREDGRNGRVFRSFVPCSPEAGRRDSPTVFFLAQVDRTSAFSRERGRLELYDAAAGPGTDGCGAKEGATKQKSLRKRDRWRDLHGVEALQGEYRRCAVTGCRFTASPPVNDSTFAFSTLAWPA